MIDLKERILCNPIHKKLFEEFLNPDPNRDPLFRIYGIEIVFSEHIPPTKTEKRWVFPNDRFITYEPSDEAWCRPLGIGHEITIDTGEPLIFRMKRPKEFDWSVKFFNSNVMTT